MTRLMPSAAVTSGNTPVTVMGNNFLASESLVCRFGQQVVGVAKFVSPFRIVCYAPAGVPGPVSVEVALNPEPSADRVATLIPEPPNPDC